MKKIAILWILLYNVIGYSQNKYPQNYFQNPLEIPLVLAGSFGELRSNHFHAGLDLKTNKQEGLNVLASADGYVSRIKIQHWGYGKALYITHPNGYVTVYAHLKKFSPEIEQYVKRQQYNKKSYTIQLFPKQNQLSVQKGKLIAYSGNTGGSSGPHLHFEIRSAKTGRTINPLLFGVDIKDTKNPVVQNAYVYPLDDFARVNNLAIKQKLNLTKQKNGNFLADKITAFGSIGFGIQSFDRMNGAMNKNGLYKLELLVNKEKIYQHTLEQFSFSEGRYINLLIDYAHYFHKKEKIQQCFRVPNNKLSIYSSIIDNGHIDIQDGLSYTIEIIASDFKGNTTKVTIPVQGKQQDITFTEEDSLPYHFKRDAFNKVSKGIVTLAIPKRSFYTDVDFDFTYEDGIAKVYEGSIPMHKSFTLSFDVSEYPKEEQKKLFIGRINDEGYVSYVNTKYTENKLFTLSKTLGNYKLASDNVQPTITPKNFKDKQWVANTLVVEIKDEETGIKSYKATIDGQWILMEYEPKKNTLTYDLNDMKTYLTSKTSKHQLKIIVSDEVGNTNTYITTFYKK